MHMQRCGALPSQAPKGLKKAAYLGETYLWAGWLGLFLPMPQGSLVCGYSAEDIFVPHQSLV